MSKKGNNKIIKKVVIILLIIAIVISVGVIAVLNLYFEKESPNTSLIINNNNVTERLKKDVIVENDSIYISKEDIKNFLDKYLYIEDNTNKIITTYDKKVAAMEVGSKTVEINGAQKTIYAEPIERNDTIYLPISEIEDVYNLYVEYISNTNTVTMDSLNRKQEKAYINKNVVVKSKARVFSSNVDKVKKDSWVICISETNNGWEKIRTENGKIGYVKKSKLTNFVTSREEMTDEKQIEGKVNLVWDYFSEYATAPNRAGTSIEGINVVSPSFFYINSKGEFKENIGQAGQAYIDWAHSKGYKVWPIVSNAEGGIEITSQILNKYETRQKLIENIVDSCVKYKLDGINVDFENMYKDDKNMFSRLIIELTPRLNEIGMVTSVDVTAPDGAENWSLCFDRNVIGDVADYIIFMAYDQYGASSKKAGTTAGFNWIETNLKKFIETEEIKNEKIVLAIPLYTRMWTEKGDSVSSKTVDMKDVDNAIPNSVQREWNDTLKQNYVEYTEGSATKKMWIEDIDSIKAKLSLVTQYQLGGVASWEKDRETEEVWSTIKEVLQQ